MPLGSRASAMKAADTAKVAPWRRCAGPKTSPRNECAIMMWSETSTANTRPPELRTGILDERAERAALGAEDGGKSCRQIMEGDGWRNERVEGCVAEQRKSRREPPAMRPA